MRLDTQVGQHLVQGQAHHGQMHELDEQELHGHSRSQDR